MPDEDCDPSLPYLNAMLVTEGLARFIPDRDRAEELLAQLGDAPYLRLKGLVRKLAATEPWPVAAALLKMARRIVATKPSRATELARLALQAAQRTKLPERFTMSLFAEAETLMGDAWRRLRKFHEAERAFARAARHLDGAGDPNQSAIYCCQLADLREAQGRREEALALRERAASLFGEIGQIDDQAQALLDKVTAELARDEVASALCDLRAVIVLADKGLRPDLTAMGVAVYGQILCQLGRATEALAVVRAFRERSPEFEDVSLLAKLDLLEGGLLTFSPHIEEADSRLDAARREFLRLGRKREAALTSMGLAMLRLREGRCEAALKSLVEETLEPLSRARDLSPRLRAALRRFCAAVANGTATEALAGVLLDHMATLSELESSILEREEEDENED